MSTGPDTPKEEKKEITLVIDHQMAMHLGLMMDLYLKTNGMKVIEPVSALQQQIKPQITKDPESK